MTGATGTPPTTPRAGHYQGYQVRPGQHEDRLTGADERPELTSGSSDRRRSPFLKSGIEPDGHGGRCGVR